MRASTTLAGASANQARALAPSWFLGALAGLLDRDVSKGRPTIASYSDLLKQAAKNLAEMANPGVLQVVQAGYHVKKSKTSVRQLVLTASPCKARSSDWTASSSSCVNRFASKSPISCT
jgi:hypothetical protein